jgi:hypothetical protein
MDNLVRNSSMNPGGKLMHAISRIYAQESRSSARISADPILFLVNGGTAIRKQSDGPRKTVSKTMANGKFDPNDH